MDLLIKIAFYVKKVNNIFNIKMSYSVLILGGQLYCAFPFSKTSLVQQLETTRQLHGAQAPVLTCLSRAHIGQCMNH